MLEWRGDRASHQEMSEEQITAFVEQMTRFQKEIGLEKYEPVLHYNYLCYGAGSMSLRLYDDRTRQVSISTLWLTKDEIYSLSQEKRVACLDAVLSELSYFSPLLSRKYNVNHALKMLQISVGLSPYMAQSFEFDINWDGVINASDALLALQSSVGLVACADRCYISNQLQGIPEMSSRVNLYKWEYERPYNKDKVYAYDINNDRVADAIDILIAYRELWS